MSLTYSEGQILVANKYRHPKAYHLIVYLKQSQQYSSHFVGLMLTHEAGKGNIPMKAEHFTNGFIFQNTHVVNAYLLKPEEWRPFKSIGNLTIEGLNFIYTNIQTQNPILWEDYTDEEKNDKN